MTVDELDIKAINIDEATELLFTTGEFEDKGEAKNAVNSAVETIKELQWYRSQDLIKIEDVVDEIEYECNCAQSEILHRLTIIDVINQIPIVEYRGDDSE